MSDLLKISLSAGHDFHTPGKRTPDGMPEWVFNSVVVKYMMTLLAEYQDVAVLRLDDPTGQKDISLAERSDRSVSWGAHVHIDIHANAYGSGWNEANGIETFVYKHTELESSKLANVVQENLIKYTGLKSRGVKEGNFHMIRETKAKAKILVEAGFMTNKKEAALLKSDEYRNTVAKAIVDALVAIYGLKKKQVGKQYRLKSGPFPTKEQAEKVAADIRKNHKITIHIVEE
ncbi:N-acetylmuramoyl-L-alanine amidase [Pseudoneobacillus rhizosphaerae]|uniref:Sporulation-specific N-acetylmuramoyl-L-alanine amidase n=1 Tax=Pseudoneobacillus rhizosphaerae TaxID=2880968 RepID=A0A9C7G969_9BACI|nr:N-acetylmuramoyl-L-alanine amidase [Pseudoneobacillus rhizosphaerae]CAG9608068.1 Sporulation-specific N-acetylmuramoyl-L-alanine amidase [Pseudoneobacillus rhizosphaerae]